MKTILAFLACLSEYIIFCIIEPEFFYDKFSPYWKVYWKFFFIAILLSIITITWKAIVGQKKEIDLNNTEHTNNSNQIRSIDDEIKVPSRARKTKERLIIALLCVWSFLNFLFFLTPFGYNVAFEKTYKFFPFTYDGTNKEFSNFFDVRFYDYTELFFYVGGAWLLYLLSKRRVTKAIAKLKIEITKNKDKLIIVSLCA